MNQRLRAIVLERDHHRCVWCGEFTDEPEVDHIHPVRWGGLNTLDNLVTSCRPCNRAKRDKIICVSWFPKIRSGWYYDREIIEPWDDRLPGEMES